MQSSKTTAVMSVRMSLYDLLFHAFDGQILAILNTLRFQDFAKSAFSLLEISLYLCIAAQNDFSVFLSLLFLLCLSLLFVRLPDLPS